MIGVFTYCGMIRQAGSKFGRWLDLLFYQLILAAAATFQAGAA
jgi:L-amino acid N-acyltransferase YncA